MKTVWKSLVAAVALTAAVNVSQAQIVVRARLGRPARTVVVNRPPAPGPRAVWVEEDWRPAGRTYAWRGGYWATPPRARATWVPGHWANRPRGYVWVPGRWR